ncbi:glycoside hydrolase family 36 protein [Agriterribacter sp.]|uniref:glycoside hydrolase family 36 protein n=1 Tax=Agriterribacter sp. TaxID=2821509 RepID=UPI002C370BCB|nr:glycoside hydrolase family 36 protein [Agriterribacter sp.]HTN08810.1 glycoside hydrolase family 36 protein [Agriterribacter sp.]
MMKTINGCIPNCRRLVETPAGAARRGRCLHRPHEAKQCDNLECTAINRKANHGIVRSIIITIFGAILMCVSPANSQPLLSPSSKGIDVHKWIEKNFAKGKVPPFSFIYRGKSSDTFIKSWRFSTEKMKSFDTNVEKTVYTYSDVKSSLIVKCEVTSFNDFPAVEWLIRISNGSSVNNTPVISSLAAADHTFFSVNEGGSTLYHALGSDAKREDFMPLKSSLAVGSGVYMTPKGGRSSDATAFPFFNIETPDKTGIMVAIGWTGKWYANVQQKSKHAVVLKAGMENFSLYLLPKEEIRSPKVCLLFWKGEDRMVGHNQFRKLILAHYTRKINGDIPQLPLAAFLDREGPVPCNEHVCATENHSISEIKRHRQFNILPEVFWLDAGWYPCEGYWPNVGNWTPNKDNFPNGLKPISDAAHQVGSKFLLWFEPERVSKNKSFISVDKEHPDWVTAIPNNNNLLLNLGNKDARLWITNHISNMIQKEGISYYRQDFNFDPLPFWKQMDGENRAGMAEIRHIEGLYAFWDSLLARFPDLIIDNCASGGRRLDLETTSRSSPFWRTDYTYGEPIGSQCHTYGLNFYLPLTGTGSFEMSSYHFRSAMSSNMVTDWDIENKKYKLSDMQKLIQEFKELRPYYYHSDYYPLTDTVNMLNDDVWLAYQMNRFEKGDGLVMAFRRPQSLNNNIVVKLKGLDAKASYEVKNQDTGEKTTRSGIDLAKGITLTLNEGPASLCLIYRKL